MKFLSAIALGGEEKNRFLREAQAAAALNHPNIATIYEVDEVDGQSFVADEAKPSFAFSLGSKRRRCQKQ